MDFPVSLKDYNKIEFYPIYVSKQKKEDILNLLLITADENKHYVLRIRRKNTFVCIAYKILVQNKFF